MLSSPLPFVILSSVLSFTFLVSPLDGLGVDMELTWTLPMTPISIFILTYVHFYLYFYLYFPMLPCLTFISGVLTFLSHTVIDHLLVGLYSFLLGSPARCAKYCNYLCQ